jgi:radical SAM superfamily enzyme YgiQ (UPF0313 family)
MILFIEPISKNLSMYVPAYSLPLIEIASFVQSNMPEIAINIVSISMDYGLPLTGEGKEQIYRELLEEISVIKPRGIGISCTAIAQAEETIHLCEIIKNHDPDIFVFLGGYFPTIYYEEIFSRTQAVDLIVIGEGEVPALEIIKRLECDKNPIDENIPGLAWKKDGCVHLTKKGVRFDLNNKALLNLELLRHPQAYDILPYAFSRGCPYHCNFCMEEFIRPIRKKVPLKIIQKDLRNLALHTKAHTLLVSDALFKSFNQLHFLRSMGMKANFETRCDVLDPSIIPKIADVCGLLALGFESASYSTLKRMGKVRDRDHYQYYVSNTFAIFKEAVKNQIPVTIFMIAGYPGDTEEDLEKSLIFAKELSKNSGMGGHIFKIGECRVYPNTKIYDLTVSLLDVVFDGDGVFGDNIVRQPSKNLDFETVLAYMTEISSLANNTPKMQRTVLNMMPFFRLSAHALSDEMIPDVCFRDSNREIFDVRGESLAAFRKLVPRLTKKYKKWISAQRSDRTLQF